MDVSKNGGTQQPWVFLLKMIILGCFGGTPIFGNTHIYFDTNMNMGKRDRSKDALGFQNFRIFLFGEWMTKGLAIKLSTTYQIQSEFQGNLFSLWVKHFICFFLHPFWEHFNGEFQLS